MAQGHETGPGEGRRSDETVLLVAGVVDMALEQAEGALRRFRSLLGRSDLGELAQDVRRDLVARGRNSGLDPARAVSSESHMELLARRARARADRDRAAEHGMAGADGVRSGARHDVRNDVGAGVRDDVRDGQGATRAAEPGHPG